MFQKRFSLILCLLLSAAHALGEEQALGSIVPQIQDPLQNSAMQVADYSTGETKIKQSIGLLLENGTASLHLAQTSNLIDDLNIAAIAENMGCITVMGKHQFKESLARPLTVADKDSALADRINAIAFLVNNPEKKKEIEQFLHAVKEYEQDLIQLMSEYFKGKTCPELAQLALIKKVNPALYPMNEFLELNPTGRFVKTGLNLATLPIDIYGVYLFSAYDFRPFYTRQTQMIMAGFCGLISGLVTYELYKEYSTASEKRTKMHALHKLIYIAHDIEKMANQNGIKMQFKISAIKDSAVLEVINQLKNARYQDKNTLFFITPLVHGLLYKLYQNEKQLAQIFASIAEMDVYNAIATKIIESKHKTNKFCFAQFVESKTPCIKTKGFWNLLVPNPVVNTIAEDKNILLTGPNAGGKTTSIRSILQNILLAQTYGVAAAEEFEFTMFDVIESYLHISDDLINGDSHFKSEVKRAQGILAKIKSLQTGKKYFFALDELFTGTVAEDGEACAYNFVERLSEFEEIQFIYATHFKRLKTMGSENARCANYKVDAPVRDAAGTLVYPFTLSAGSSNVHIGVEIAKDAGLFA